MIQNGAELGTGMELVPPGMLERIPENAGFPETEQ